MADPAETEGAVVETPDGEVPLSKWRRDMEAENRSLKEERSALKRELAFTKAGLTGLSDKQVKALAATHDGEMTPAALLETAKELGFAPQSDVKPEAQPAPEPDRRADELAKLAALGSTPTSVTAARDAKAELRDQLANFKGGSKALEEFVLANADLILSDE